MSIGAALVVLIAFGAAIVFAWLRGRRSPLSRAVLARPSLEVDALIAEAVDQPQLDPTLAREVLRGLGLALEIDPGKLRLPDEFEALWDMNPQAGFHQRATFESWLVKRFPRLAEIPPAATVADLIGALQRLPMVR